MFLVTHIIKILETTQLFNSSKIIKLSKEHQFKIDKYDDYKNNTVKMLMTK